MTRNLSLALALTVTSAALTVGGSHPAQADSGCPSPTEPDLVAGAYQIESEGDLMWLKGDTARWALQYKLLDNLDMSGCTWSSGIGVDDDDKFTGTFDGQGNSISNLTITNAAAGNLGLFGFVDDASISDLTISGSVTGLGSLGLLVGVVSGSNGASIVNVSATGTVTGQGDGRDGDHVGGLVGSIGKGGITGSTANVAVTIEGAIVSARPSSFGGLVGLLSNEASVSGSTATGNITLENDQPTAGGLVGYADGSVSNSSASGNIIGGAVSVGGLIGHATSTISGSHATGNVSPAGTASGAAGLVGLLQGGSVVESYAEGDVAGTGNYLAGLVGSSVGGEIEQSYSTGTVTATTRFVAGLVASGDATTSITDSYTTSTINFSGSDYVGGIIGYANGTQITTSYSAATMSGTNNTNVGGLIGAVASSGAASNSFFDEDLADRTDTTGGSQPESTNDMKNLSTFSDATWDIGDGWQSGETWGICDGTTYPFLIWQYDESPCSLTTPTVDTAESTSSGFTFNVTNYDSDYTYSFSATSGSASAGTASGSDLPVTVTGVSGGASSTVTVTASRTGYASSDVSLTGRATGGGSSGSGGSPSTPAPTAEPTTSPTIPTIQINSDSLLLNPGGGPLVVPAGGAAAYSGTGELPTPELIQEGSLWTAAGPGYALQVLGPQPLDVQERSTTAATIPVVTNGQSIALAARGYAPGETVRGWIVSSSSPPTEQPAVAWEVDATGAATGTLLVDVQVPGSHTLQLRGLTPSGSVLTVLLGLEVTPRASVSRFAITFRTDRDVLTKRSRERLAAALSAGQGPSIEVGVTIRRLRADGSDGRQLARVRKRELQKELISLGVPRGDIDISIKGVKKPRFAKRSIVDVRLS